MCTTHNRKQSRTRSLDRGLRAGDADRDAVVDMLREQHLAGRIDSEEFQERIDRSYAAKTYGDLDALVADLPAEMPRQRPAPRSRGRRSVWPGFALLPLLIALLVLSQGYLVWAAIPLFLFVVRPLLLGPRSGWGYWGGGPRANP